MNQSRRKVHQDAITRQMSKTGLRGRLNAKCIECIYDPAGPGSWRQQVAACSSPQCPLYDVRPQPLSSSSQ